MVKAGLMIIKKILIFYFLINLDFVSKLYAKGIAIIGDSLATGAGTHQNLSFDPDVMWDVLKGKVKIEPNLNHSKLRDFLKVKTLDEPVYLMKSRREYSGAIEWVITNTLRTFNKNFFNTQQYSWGYILGKRLGYRGDEIYIAGENGARISSLTRQVDRVLDYLNGDLPDQIFILFTGNDLCAQNLNFMTSTESFRQSLSRGLKYIAINGRSNPHGTIVNVISYLGVSQLLLNESILNKKVVAFGEKTTCEKLRINQYMPENLPTNVRNPESLYMSHIIPPNPVKYCPTLFSIPPVIEKDDKKLSNLDINRDTFRTNNYSHKRDEMLSILANRVRNYRSISQEVADEVNDLIKAKYPQKNITFRFITNTEILQFDENDAAEDCFHLSIDGQLKLAKTIFNEMKSQKLH